MPKETKDSCRLCGYITFCNKLLTSHSFPRIGKLDTPVHSREQGYPQESLRISRISLEPAYLEEVDTLTVPFKVDTTHETVEVEALIDSGTDGYAFIDKTFARKSQLPLIPLSYSRNLDCFDGNPVVSGPVTYYVNKRASLPNGKMKNTCFFVTTLPNYPIVLGLPYLKAHRAVLDLEMMTLRYYPSVIAKGPAMIPIGSKAHPWNQLDLRLASALSFKRITRQKGHILGAILLDNIEKALNPKPKSDLATKLPEHYKDYLDVFDRKESDKLPPHRPFDCKIPLQEGKEPPYGPLYSMSRDELQVVRNYLKENLQKGFIRASSSQASSPVLLVRKPGGGLRFCVDYRALNEITTKNRYPTPLMRETLNMLCKARHYSKIDIIAAFNKLRVAEGEEWKTAFRTRDGLFEYTVMPFGLCRAPSDWQAFINNVLREYLDQFCTAYADDILIYSDNLKDHRRHVRLILQKLREAGIQADIDKCDFNAQEVVYLGLILTPDGVKMDPSKVKNILEWQTPRTLKELQSFMGFANFYRRFIENFSLCCKPLTALTRKDTPFVWTSVCQQAFDNLKLRFTQAPVLRHFDPELDIIVETDASDEVVAGVLSQRDHQGVIRPVAFFSTKMSPAELNYEIYDKELLAIIRAFEEWRPELQGSKFPVQVITDHKNLEYFMTNKLLTPRQARWSTFLSQFDFKIKYRPGRLNTVADALTRRTGNNQERKKHNWQTVIQPKHMDEPLRLSANTVTSDTGSVTSDTGSVSSESDNDHSSEGGSDITEEETIILSEELPQRALQDELYQEIKAALLRGDRKMKNIPLAELELIEDLIVYRHSRYLVPELNDFRTEVIRQHHDSSVAGHPGRARTYELLQRNYWWPGISDDVNRYVKNCVTCRRAKPAHDPYQGMLKSLPVPERRWADISIDFIVEAPPTLNLWGQKCSNMLVIVDRLTKNTWIEPVHSMTAEDTAKVFYRSIWPNHGLPTSIISDRGTQFVSHFWDELCKRLGIKVNLSTAFHPETDGQTENHNQMVEAYLRIFTSYLQNDWGLWIPSAIFAMNNAFSQAIQCTPFFANTGQHPRMGVEPIQPRADAASGKELMDRQRADFFADKMIQITEALKEQMVWAQS